MANLGYIQVTRHCNQNCRFCSNPVRKVHLSLKKGLQNIDELKEQGFVCVMLTGGEPTISKHLPAFIAHCKEINIMCKLCSNGQNLSDPSYLDLLIENGLNHVCISLHSYRPDVQDFLTQNPGSLEHILRALENLSSRPDVAVDILTTINKYNSGHLNSTVLFLIEYFPFIHNITWNNLDPRMNRATQNPDTIPMLRDFELELFLSMELLESEGIPFHVERVPLCYMPGHAHHCTETRRIVKNEERLTFFLDERGRFLCNEWSHDKADCCAVCSLNGICAGLFEMDKYYSSSELFPVFVNKDNIVSKILADVTIGPRRIVQA